MKDIKQLKMELEQSLKHMGPGNHPDGSPQSVHGANGPGGTSRRTFQRQMARQYGDQPKKSKPKPNSEQTKFNDADGSYRHSTFMEAFRKVHESLEFSSGGRGIGPGSSPESRVPKAAEMQMVKEAARDVWEKLSGSRTMPKDFMNLAVDYHKGYID